MKLSKKTLAILKNFSTVNTNLFIMKDTNIIRTVSEASNIFVESELEEYFPEEIGIYNLHKLLQTVSMFDKPEFEFKKTHILIEEAEGDNTFKYFYTPSNCLKYPKKSIPELDTPLSFDLTEDTLVQITKASRATSLPDVNIKYENNVVELQLKDRSNSTSNVFSFKIDGKCSIDRMSVYMKVDNFKMIPCDYHVRVGDAAARFKTTSPDLKSLEYCVAMEL